MTKLTADATENCLDAEEGLVTVKSSISLTDEHHAFARALVDAGRFASPSAVLQQGVDLLRQRMDTEELETAALRELLSWRRKGEVVGAEEMDARLAGEETACIRGLVDTLLQHSSWRDKDEQAALRS